VAPSAPLPVPLRAATAADSSAIAALHVASWQSAYRGLLSDAYLDGPAPAERAALWEQRFREPKPNQHVIVAEADGRLTGFACAFGADDPQWGTLLDNLHVAPDLKGRGLGKALLRAIAEWCAASHPGVPLHLWVLEGNERAIRFYEALGGRRADRTTWTAPDGHTVYDLRYAWPDVRTILERTAGA